MDLALIAARFIHFAAQISLAGVLGFARVVMAPSYAACNAKIPVRLSRRLVLDAWCSLGLTALSGLAWLVLAAQSMSRESLGEVLLRNTTGTVLTATQFGRVWILRAILVMLLCPCVAQMGKRREIDRIGLLLGLALLAATAWQGHAGAAQGWELPLHLGADAAHIVAAGIWVGALIPLALLLAETGDPADRSSTAVARAAALRFSDIGLWCVVALLITGSINAWFLVGSLRALVGTLYGQLVMVKIALFATMIVLAYVNRRVLLPRLAAAETGGPGIGNGKSAARIARNARIEAGLGLVAIAIVSALGTLVPGADEQPRWTFHYHETGE